MDRLLNCAVNKLALLSALFLFWVPVAAQAALLDDIHFTGHTAGQAGDTSFIPNEFTSLPLGGPIGNDYIVEQAFEFTASRPDVIDSLLINAVATPDLDVHDQALEDYIHQQVLLGTPPDQIAQGIPNVVGPAQSIHVNFSLAAGSVPYRADPKEFFPGPDVLAGTSYTFTTNDSLNPTGFSNISLPLSPIQLDPNGTYWLVVNDPQFSGVSLSYSKQFLGTVVTPEPSTIFLLGIGLILVLFFYTARNRHS